MEEYDKDFEKAGFGPHEIDFSNVSAEMIVHLGEAIREFYGRK